MVYAANRDLVVMKDLTPPGTLCLKMRLQCAILGLAASEVELVPDTKEELSARLQGVMERLQRNSWDGAISRIDRTATMQEVLVCIPPKSVGSPLSFRHVYKI